MASEIKKEQKVPLSTKEIMRLGKLYKVGVEAEWFQEVRLYAERKINQYAKELSVGFQEYPEVCFIKGQINGLMDLRDYPFKIIKRRELEIENRAEEAEKKKKKEEKDARRGR